MSAPPSVPHPSAARQTDVRKRTILPQTLQNLRSTASSSGQAELDQLNSDEYLDKLEEELNRKVDGEVDGLVEGLKELIALARVSLYCIPILYHRTEVNLAGLKPLVEPVCGGFISADFFFHLFPSFSSLSSRQITFY